LENVFYQKEKDLKLPAQKEVEKFGKPKNPKNSTSNGKKKRVKGDRNGK